MSGLQRNWFLGLLLLCVSLALCASAQGPNTPPPIAITPQDGFNLEVVDQIDPHYVIVKLASPAHNWFAGTFTNLPTDKEVTIGLSMEGNDTPGNKADVTKWLGLCPVMTYADPTKYETYEWFTKDTQGRWVSGDPFKKGDAKFAGTGKVPEQTVIPIEVAEQFLSPDGKYWQAWREVDKAEVFDKLNIFRITQRYTFHSATLAMRIPYTYTYLQQYADRLQASKNANVFVDELGITPEKRKLQVFRIETVAPFNITDHKTVLMIGREHATEQASSWTVQGALNTAIINHNKLNATWLFIPLEDPDGSSKSIFDRMTDSFCCLGTQRCLDEVYQYIRYFIAYADLGKTIDISISLHNVEVSEEPNVFCPFIDFRYRGFVLDINSCIFDQLQKEGYKTSNPDDAWGNGLIGTRLYAWCGEKLGATCCCFEVNDRYPTNRLSLMRLNFIGYVVVNCIQNILKDKCGNAIHASALEFSSSRERKRALYLIRYHRKANCFTDNEQLLLGY